MGFLGFPVTSLFVFPRHPWLPWISPAFSAPLASMASLTSRNCVAVEDSDSGVGSAAHAGMGLIVGYVGGGQIPRSMREEAAGVLMAGGRTKDKRGADVVISDAAGLLHLVSAWRSGTLQLPITSPPDCGEGVQVWLPSSR